MKRFVAAFACLFLFPLFSAAQATPGKPAFVSATVHDSNPANQRKTSRIVVNNSCASYISISLEQLIMAAYGVTADQIKRTGLAGYPSIRHCGQDARRGLCKRCATDAPDTAERPLQAGRPYHIEEPAGAGAGGGQGRAEVTAGNSGAIGRDDHEAVRRPVDQASTWGGEPTFTGGSSDRVYSTYGYGDRGLDSTEYRGDWKVIVDQTGLTGKYLLPAPSYKNGLSRYSSRRCESTASNCN